MARTPTLIEEVTQHYLTSGRFNGVAVHQLLLRKGSGPSKLRTLLRRAIQTGKTSLVFGDRHPNPHIKAFKEESSEEQINKLDSDTFFNACVYPAPEVLAAVVDRSRYEGRPFSLRLALGEAQLEYEVFDLSVLEAYRNDPRYLFDSNDVGGHLSIRDRYFESGEMHERDEVSVRFGYALAKKDMRRRAVAVFLIDLHQLSPEHQQIWNAKRLSGDFFAHPDWWRTQMGHWPERASVFDAFLEEFEQIRTMCSIIGCPSLFRETFKGRRPREFGFLLRPTLTSFNSFVHLLDKMLSDNLSKDFFKDQRLELEIDEVRKDGKVVVRSKGTLQLLEEWLTTRFRTAYPEPLQESIAALKNVRRLRQKPAHAVNEDEFDQKYFEEQRELMLRAYGAVRILRLVLANHPSVQGHAVPDWLRDGRIWPF